MKLLFYAISITASLAFPCVWAAENECTSGDCINGLGTKHYPEGHQYTGQWKEGKRHGKGVERRENGGLVTGNYKNDRPHGYGTYTFVNSAKYAIDWTGDEKQISGPYAFSNGGKYVGGHDNREHGHGTVMYNDGGTYVGGYDHDHALDYHVLRHICRR